MEYKPRIIVARQNEKIRTHLVPTREIDDQMVKYYIEDKNANILYAQELPQGTFDIALKLTSYNERPFEDVKDEAFSLIGKIKEAEESRASKKD